MKCSKYNGMEKVYTKDKFEQIKKNNKSEIINVIYREMKKKSVNEMKFMCG